MAPSRQPLKQLSQASTSTNPPDPNSPRKIKPDPLSPHNQDNKVHKPLPTNQATHVRTPGQDQLRRGLKPLAEVPETLPPVASPPHLKTEHDIDNERKKASVELLAPPRFNLTEGWHLLNERQQMINEWKANGSLSALHARLLRQFEELQHKTARQVWLRVRQGRHWIEADIKRWNHSPMPLTEQDQHSRDQLNEDLGHVERAEAHLYGVYKSVLEPLVEAEKLARDKERLDREEMGRMVEDAYQAILAEEAQASSVMRQSRYMNVEWHTV